MYFYVVCCDDILVSFQFDFYVMVLCCFQIVLLCQVVLGYQYDIMMCFFQLIDSKLCCLRQNCNLMLSYFMYFEYEKSNISVDKFDNVM